MMPRVIVIVDNGVEPLKDFDARKMRSFPSSSFMVLQETLNEAILPRLAGFRTAVLDVVGR